jgi:leucyl/phenylalanyl-tRNA--protein transferase
MMTVYLLDKDIRFPDPAYASTEGLLAVGGDLSLERLAFAYEIGIFPWYSKEEPILWWSPDPRFLLYPKDFKLRRSLKKTIRKGLYEIRFDTAFEQVIRACSKRKRPGQDDTWITKDMIKAYIKLHQAGFAHSIEAWREGKLVGGLYGVSKGPFFFGESMFYDEPDASKVALAALVHRFRDAPFIDCQVANDFFRSMGAVDVPRSKFLRELDTHVKKPSLWQATINDPIWPEELTPRI